MSLQTSLWRLFSLLGCIKNFQIKNYFLTVNHSCSVHTAQKWPQCSKKTLKFRCWSSRTCKTFPVVQPSKSQCTILEPWLCCCFSVDVYLCICLSWYNFNLNGSRLSDHTLQLIYLSLYFHSGGLFVIGRFHKQEIFL